MTDHQRDKNTNTAADSQLCPKCNQRIPEFSYRLLGARVLSLLAFGVVGYYLRYISATESAGSAYFLLSFFLLAVVSYLVFRIVMWGACSQCGAVNNTDQKIE